VQKLHSFFIHLKVSPVEVLEFAVVKAILSYPNLTVSLENFSWNYLQTFWAKRFCVFDLVHEIELLKLLKGLKGLYILNYINFTMTEASDVKKSIYSAFSEIASSIGYSDMHGRIIAALLVNNKKMSLQDMAKETGYSISTISLSLDFLEFLGMIKKVKNAGDRKLYIELQGNLLEGLKKAFTLKIQKNITSSLNSFENYKEILKKSSNNEKRKVMDALNILENEIKKLDNYINLLSKLKLP